MHMSSKSCIDWWHRHAQHQNAVEVSVGVWGSHFKSKYLESLSLVGWLARQYMGRSEEKELGDGSRDGAMARSSNTINDTHVHLHWTLLDAVYSQYI